jgi:hypothetical protein
VLHDFADDTFVAVILARDSEGVFRSVDVDSDLPDRDAARRYAVHGIAAHRRRATIALA